MITLNLGIDALKHPLSIFEGRLQSLTCDSLTRRNGAIRCPVRHNEMCYRRLNAAAVGDRCLTRAAKASQPFGGSRHLALQRFQPHPPHPRSFFKRT